MSSVLRLSRLHRPQLVDRPQDPQPNQLRFTNALRLKCVGLLSGFDVSDIAVPLDHQTCAAPYVDVGDHWEKSPSWISSARNPETQTMLGSRKGISQNRCHQMTSNAPPNSLSLGLIRSVPVPIGGT